MPARSLPSEHGLDRFCLKICRTLARFAPDRQPHSDAQSAEILEVTKPNLPVCLQ